MMHKANFPTKTLAQVLHCAYTIIVAQILLFVNTFIGLILSEN